MNRLLGDAHVERIRMTPFKWCLHILNPLEVNLKLLKMMVQRWVGHDVSFRACQQLVPFIVLDVFMTTGLDIGGLDIPFDESIVGLLNLEWYVSKQDRQVPEIRATFHMDDGGMGEGSMAERSRVQETYDESSDDGTWEAGVEERMRKNNHDIMTLNAKIVVITRELIDIRQTPIFNEQAAFGHDEEGVGAEEEAPTYGGDEKDADGDDEHPVGPYNEEAGDEEPPHEDDKLAASQHMKMEKHRCVCIEIDDGDDDDDEGEVPLAIPPLRSFIGDPSTTVDVDQLYYVVSTLSTTSVHTLAPLEYVDNMVVLFAATIFMHFENKLSGVVKRIHLSSLYANHVISDLRKRPQNQQVYTLHNYQTYMHSNHFGLGDIVTVDFAENIARFFCILYNRPEGSIRPLSVEQANIPSQPNLHDCGVIMLKAMEIWDGEDKYNGKSMPQYTNEELRAIRKNYVRDWILDNDNIRRMEALAEYGLL
ncbi:uncharacterized protein HKW66_Vig0181860 [Vigna angularis]|uniref:Ubiquitin-like protease family profile domain-containing protein n=1 Tax=Phaseolus angularis TaxID=3914 RepID=A0A8T0K4C8_PHAAN|nr:uncharacterized protein HKW66_Vig0181860 [Vigna angularis]